MEPTRKCGVGTSSAQDERDERDDAGLAQEDQAEQRKHRHEEEEEQEQRATDDRRQQPQQQPHHLQQQQTQPQQLPQQRQLQQRQQPPKQQGENYPWYCHAITSNNPPAKEEEQRGGRREADIPIREDRGDNEEDGDKEKERQRCTQNNSPACVTARLPRDREFAHLAFGSEAAAPTSDSDRGAPVAAGAPHQPETRLRGGRGPETDQRDDKWRYELKVVQQPIRARMCGFGDKDRRPTTPPPVVELVVSDAYGAEIDLPSSEVSFYVVMCDLFSAEGTCEMNLVVHPGAAGAATAIDTSGKRRRRRESKDEMDAPCSPATAASAASQSPAVKHVTRTVTRNLVGSVVANAMKLTRLEAEPAARKNVQDSVASVGIFFVFPDISVRTEGMFRLRFSFLDLRSTVGYATTTGTTRVLTRTFSDVFTVYCAKDFPGMIESTPLSRWFARQGVKIHGRRDTTGRRRGSQVEECEATDDRKPDEAIERGALALPAAPRAGVPKASCASTKVSSVSTPAVDSAIVGGGGELAGVSGGVDGDEVFPDGRIPHPDSYASTQQWDHHEG